MKFPSATTQLKYATRQPAVTRLLPRFMKREYAETTAIKHSGTLSYKTIPIRTVFRDIHFRQQDSLSYPQQPGGLQNMSRRTTCS